MHISVVIDMRPMYPCTSFWRQGSSQAGTLHYMLAQSQGQSLRDGLEIACAVHSNTYEG